MLSDHTIAIVKFTAPILEEHGELLTRHFYKRMFEKNPEVAPFFNRTNQAQGTQQKALAAAHHVRQPAASGADGYRR